ncbi:MAG TPA: alpha/beta fold hydrolase [Chitinophagaceae bacterium]|nr:alpha/beta fold hydrolase [Chitinophagaceae bacterium]
MEPAITFYPASLPQRTAVTLVVHGLNLKPSAMLPLVHWLSCRGSEVYLVHLSGHGEGSREMKEVTPGLWAGEMQEGYDRARRAAAESGVPLYFLGYSLGALLGQSMIAGQQEGAAFDKQVLVAPAIGIRRHAYALRLLFPLGGKRTLPSFTPVGYRANPSLPLSVYRILFDEERKVLRSGFGPLRIPTLVVMDPRDELVSYRRWQQIAYNHLSSCRLLSLDPNLEGRNHRYHHLVIDERTMGKANWERFTGALDGFLFPG